MTTLATLPSLSAATAAWLPAGYALIQEATFAGETFGDFGFKQTPVTNGKWGEWVRNLGEDRFVLNDAVFIDFCISSCDDLHMRTTISIAEDLLKRAQRLTGRSGYSDAIVTSLKDYVAVRERMAYLEKLYSQKPPHSLRKIKSARKKRRWSS